MKNNFFKNLTLSTLIVIVSIQTLEAKRFSKSDIDKMCSQNQSIPSKGKQFNGQSANKTVMNLKAGKYSYPNGMLLLYSSNYYLLKIPKSKNRVQGTDGNDLIGAGGILGGCSKEQLSEAIQSNKLSIDKFKLIKRYR